MQLNRTFSTVIAAIVVLAGFCGTASAQRLGAARVTADQAAVRQRPAVDSSILFTVERDETLDVLAQEGTWLRVRVPPDGPEGFVHVAFVTRVGATEAAAITPRGTAPPVTAQNLHVSAPSSTGIFVGLDGDGRGGIGGPALQLHLGFLTIEGIGTRKDGVSTLSALGAVTLARLSFGETVEIRPQIGGGVLKFFPGSLCDDHLGLPECGETTLGGTGFGQVAVALGRRQRIVIAGRVGYLKTPRYLDAGSLGISVAGFIKFR